MICTDKLSSLEKIDVSRVYIMDSLSTEAITRNLVISTGDVSRGRTQQRNLTSQRMSLTIVTDGFHCRLVLLETLGETLGAGLSLLLTLPWCHPAV